VPESLSYDPQSLPRLVCGAHPEWAHLADAAWRIAFDNVVYTEGDRRPPRLSCMPGVSKTWVWDSCFMTFFARYSNGTLPAMNNIDAFYDLQRADGFIGMTYDLNDDSLSYGERVNPPLFAWVEWEWCQVTGDDSRFARVLDPIIRHFDWIQRNRRRPSGLYWFEDSGSTGMDNSPRSGYAADRLAGSDVCFVDLLCQQALGALCIQRIAKRLGRDEVAARFAEEHQSLTALANRHHWSAATGFYYDLFAQTHPGQRHNFLNHMTIAALWSLISEVAADDQVQSIAGHLADPRTFSTPHPVPTLSRDDPNYDRLGGYWLGGVWSPANYMICEGLRRRGHGELAFTIATKHLRAVQAVADDPRYGGLWECYSPERSQPGTAKLGELSRPNFVGWTGLTPISMLIEHVFGLDFSASAGRIRWVIRQEGTHGVQNLRFNGALTSCVYHPPATGDPTGRVEIETAAPITLELTRGDRSPTVTHELRAGRHTVPAP
jgi:glycogen debranching enzyme